MVVTTEIMLHSHKKLKMKRLHQPTSSKSESLMKQKQLFTTTTKLAEHNVKLVAQELKFAKLLAGNDAQTSQNQLKKIEKWLKIRSQSSFREYII